MTLIQKLTIKLKKLFSHKESEVQSEEPGSRVLTLEEYLKKHPEKAGQIEFYYYIPKDRLDPLEFQDRCNTELFWNDQGG